MKAHELEDGSASTRDPMMENWSGQKRANALGCETEASLVHVTGLMKGHELDNGWEPPSESDWDCGKESSSTRGIR